MVGMGDGRNIVEEAILCMRDGRVLSWVYDSATLYLLSLEVETWNKRNYPQPRSRRDGGR